MEYRFPDLKMECRFPDKAFTQKKMRGIFSDATHFC